MEEEEENEEKEKQISPYPFHLAIEHAFRRIKKPTRSLDSYGLRMASKTLLCLTTLLTHMLSKKV